MPSDLIGEPKPAPAAAFFAEIARAAIRLPMVA
jgi:hypothetical protein